MRRVIPLLVFFLLAIPVSAAIQIVEFCPDPYQHDDTDEYLVLYGTESLDDITISDNKGGFRFPAGTAIGGYLTIARSAQAYVRSHGRNPDFEWLNTSATVPDVINGDPLRLANAKDELLLYDRNILSQKVSWPGDVTPREGQVHYLENGVWDRRVLMLGQSKFSPASFPNASVIAFVSPDCSGEVYSEAIRESSDSIFVNMYEFSSPSMGDALIAAKKRGVNVRVLVEGGPVGGISPSEKSLIWNINRSGIPVVSMISSKTEHAPYRYDHAKYLVIDNRSLFITSENFKNTGFPPQGVSGNRGWGVYIRNPGLAEYFSKVFSSDSTSKSVIPYVGSQGDSEPAQTEKYPAEFEQKYFEGATIVPVLAPDTSYQITDLLNSAGTSIEIEQAYIKNETPETLNPFLSSAINASRRGVHVRILLDSFWFNVEGPNDNDEMVNLINHIAMSEHLPLEAKCIDLSTSPVEKIHNKGVIVDEKRVLVSSINWNMNSPTFNREAGVIIDHPGVAGYFLEVFDDDWNSSVKSEGQRADYAKIAIVGIVIVFLLIIYYRRHRT
jgi:phosphatidylserine/phosphatidylglycerophosphate/cardiolipin synthase-like enzyme